MAIAFISFGSNLGNRLENVIGAITSLKNKNDIDLREISSTIETESVGAIGPAYLNGVIKIETRLSPLDLLSNLQSIEESLGRVRTYRNAPRVIDLDILLYDDLLLSEPRLTIPHRQLWERDFILKLVLEIEPEVKKLDCLKGRFEAKVSQG